jgi:RNA polymerase sigma-70 factor (ECF subfamily)
MDLTFEYLQREYYRKMVAYASTFPRINGAEREDIAHDALVHAYFARGKYDPARPLNAWLYTVARNYILDLLRARGPDTVPYDDAFDPAPDDQPDSLDDPDTDAELVRVVRREIGRLDERDKRIAMLVFYEEMSCADAARALGLPAGTVRWRIHEIRQRLAKKLGEREART